MLGRLPWLTGSLVVAGLIWIGIKLAMLAGVGPDHPVSAVLAAVLFAVFRMLSMLYRDGGRRAQTIGYLREVTLIVLFYLALVATSWLTGERPDVAMDAEALLGCCLLALPIVPFNVWVFKRGH